MWSYLVGGLKLEERVADAVKAHTTKSKENKVGGVDYKHDGVWQFRDNFVYCGWSDDKTSKLQMETDKFLRRQVSQFRFMSHVVVEPFDIVQM